MRATRAMGAVQLSANGNGNDNDNGNGGDSGVNGGRRLV